MRQSCTSSGESSQRSSSAAAAAGAAAARLIIHATRRRMFLDDATAWHQQCRARCRRSCEHNVCRLTLLSLFDVVSRYLRFVLSTIRRRRVYDAEDSKGNSIPASFRVYQILIDIVVIDIARYAISLKL